MDKVTNDMSVLAKERKRILCSAPHPDDEILGCGAVLADLVIENEVTVLYVTEGRGEQASQARKALQELIVVDTGSRVLAERDISAVYLNLCDQTLDILPQSELADAIGRVVDRVRPHVVFVPSLYDVNADHRAAFAAALVALRPTVAPSVESVLIYETPSSSECGWPRRFDPDTVIEVSEHAMACMIAAMFCYKDEFRSSPHPRSGKALNSRLAWVGQQAGMEYAMAFQTVRRVLRLREGGWSG